jgi:hypothetical protein
VADRIVPFSRAFRNACAMTNYAEVKAELEKIFGQLDE